MEKGSVWETGFAKEMELAEGTGFAMEKDSVWVRGFAEVMDSVSETD